MSLTAEISTSITAAIELAMNTALRLDPAHLKKLDPFSGKVIAIELRGLELKFYLMPSAQGIILMSQYAGQADTTLSGKPLGLANMAFGDARQALFSGEVIISGDVELGQQFKRWMDNLDIDWEEQLSHLVGDIAAHKMGDVFRSATSWGQQAIKIIGQNTAEYLQQEGQDLPLRESVNSFNQEIDVLRDDVARIEARINRLSKKLT